MNFKLTLQPHQNWISHHTVWKTWLSIANTQMKDDYTTNCHYMTYTWDNVLLKLGVKGPQISRVPICVDQTQSSVPACSAPRGSSGFDPNCWTALRGPVKSERHLAEQIRISICLSLTLARFLGPDSVCCGQRDNHRISPQSHLRLGFANVPWRASKPTQWFLQRNVDIGVTESARLQLPSWKSKFSQSSKPKFMNEVVRIGSIFIFHPVKLWKAKFFKLCVIFLVRLQGKFEIDHSGGWHG